MANTLPAMQSDSAMTRARRMLLMFMRQRSTCSLSRATGARGLNARQKFLGPDIHRHRRNVLEQYLAVRTDQERFGRPVHAPVDRDATFLVFGDRRVRIAERT